MSALASKDGNAKPGSLLSGLSRSFEKTQSLPAKLDQDSGAPSDLLLWVVSVP